MDKIIYYEDELNDDFSITNIESLPLSKKFKYVRKNPLWLFWSWFSYTFLARPLCFILMKIFYHHKFVNRRKIKYANKTGCYIYGNHTQGLVDTFVPNIINFRRRNYIVVGRETFSIPFVQNLVLSLGAIPLGDTFEHKKDMLKCFKTRIKQHSSITIYPEAHIWPYYTKIRPFSEESFKYAVKENVPVYALTNCYQKKKFFKVPKVITFLDGPYYPKEDLNMKENMKYLRDTVYNQMCKRSSENSNYEYVKYIKKETK